MLAYPNRVLSKFQMEGNVLLAIHLAIHLPALITVSGSSQTLSLKQGTMLAYPDRVLSRVSVEWDIPLALYLPVLTDGLGSSQTLIKTQC